MNQIEANSKVCVSAIRQSVYYISLHFTYTDQYDSNVFDKLHSLTQTETAKEEKSYTHVRTSILARTIHTCMSIVIIINH